MDVVAQKMKQTNTTNPNPTNYYPYNDESIQDFNYKDTMDLFMDIDVPLEIGDNYYYFFHN